MEVAHDVKLESGAALDFLEEVQSIPGGEKIKDCIQCGTCSGSCPTSYMMDYTPRRLFAMIRAGLKEEVLSSDALWICSSCYQCTVRCPREIKITDVIYALKNLAFQSKSYPKGQQAQKLSENFVKVVNKYGRNHELELTARYYLTADPKAMMNQAPLGWNLFRQGRMPIKPHKIKNIKQLQAIVEKAESFGGV